jgi:hypothetical protein
MKLPTSLPSLEEQNFILDNPAPVQYLFRTIIIFLPLIGSVWIFDNYRSGNVEFYHLLIGMILLVWMTALFNRNFWRRWVSFAADRKGIYIGNSRFEYIFIPWADVGDSSIGYGRIGKSKLKCVLLEINISGNLWNEIQRTNFGDLARGANIYALSNSLRNVEKTRESIELIRSIAKN